MKKSIISISFLILLAGCSSDGTKKIDEQISSIEIPFIHPAFKDVDVSSDEFSFNAEKGDTIEYKSGSKLLFPPNSLLDKNGNVVTGEVKIKYREFSDPVDFFVAGIPMQYDSGGTKYNFESAGMCEVNAFKGDEQLFVNPKIKPQIQLASNNNNSEFNLYYLDTASKNWVSKGKDVVSEIPKPDTTKTISVPKKKQNKKEPEIVMPAKPLKADGKKELFNVDFKTAGFEELSTYKNVLFEVDDETKNYDRKANSKVVWENLEVAKWTKPGKYKITFIKGTKRVEIIAHPVFKEGSDYDAAMKIFEQKRNESDKLLAERKKREEEVARLKLEQKKQDSMSILNDPTIASLVENARRENLFLRSFNLDKFGYWNCDNPHLSDAFLVSGFFKNEKGENVRMEFVALVYKGFNSVLPCNDSKLQIKPNTEIMIYATANNLLYFLPYDEFKKCNISAGTKDFIFTMKTSNEKITSPEQIKKIAGI